MSWINFPGFRGGPAAVTHGHSSSSSGSGGHHDPATMPMAPNESETTTTAELDIRKNMIQCAELKKLNTRFYSEVLRKKFFVLYEDSRRSVTNPRDHNTESDVSTSTFFLLRAKCNTLFYIVKATWWILGKLSTRKMRNWSFSEKWFKNDNT